MCTATASPVCPEEDVLFGSEFTTAHATIVWQGWQMMTAPFSGFSRWRIGWIAARTPRERQYDAIKPSDFGNRAVDAVLRELRLKAKMLQGDINRSSVTGPFFGLENGLPSCGIGITFQRSREKPFCRETTDCVRTFVRVFCQEQDAGSGMVYLQSTVGETKFVDRSLGTGKDGWLDPYHVPYHFPM